MVDTKVLTKEEYVSLIPPMSTADYERLKQSIKDENGLLFPIILNQDNVVLDGHHRLRACKELGLTISYNTKDFTGRPLDELKFVVSANLTRRHLDEFQKAVAAINFDKLFRKIARDRHMATQFTSETARQAANKRHKKESEDFSSSLRLASQELTRSADDLGKMFGVSGSTIERVRAIMENGTPEHIQTMMHRSEAGEKPGMRTMYEQMQNHC